jgi:hypothetical protein
MCGTGPLAVNYPVIVIRPRGIRWFQDLNAISSFVKNWSKSCELAVFPFLLSNDPSGKLIVTIIKAILWHPHNYSRIILSFLTGDTFSSALMASFEG